MYNGCPITGKFFSDLVYRSKVNHFIFFLTIGQAPAGEQGIRQVYDL